MNNTQTTIKQQNTTPVQPQGSVQATTPTPTPSTPVAQPVTQAQVDSTVEGFNLIPAMSKEEKVKVKTKNTLNLGSILSIIALASIALGIVGFNILSKAQLNSKKSSLSKVENVVNSKMDKITANNAIVDRAVLYTNVKKDSFSHKKIIEFLTEIASRLGGITYKSITISENLAFELTGNAPNLEQLSKLWYLYGVHENLNTIELSSVSKGETDVSFSFEGEFNITNFKNE